MNVDPIPSDYNRVTAYLTVDNCTKALEYYQELFGAELVMRFDMPDGKVGHAELKIGDSKIMVSDEFDEMNVKGPKSFGGTPVGLSIYVADVDKTYQKALDTGCKVIRELADQFHGDRSGQVEDPFGHKWMIASRIENVSYEEMQRRAKELFG